MTFFRFSNFTKVRSLVNFVFNFQGRAFFRLTPRHTRSDVLIFFSPLLLLAILSFQRILPFSSVRSILIGDAAVIFDVIRR